MGLFRSGLERGKGSHFMGYHPVFMVVRSLLHAAKPHCTLDGVGMLAGYLVAVLNREKRIEDDEFIRFLRKHQVRRLLLLKSEV